MNMMAHFKPFLVASFGVVSIEVLKAIPSAVTPWIQLLIGVLTVAYLIRKLIKK